MKDLQDPMVKHPAHYNQLDGIECIDVIDQWRLNYHLASVLKYVWRFEEKGNPLQDLRKGVNYLEMEMAKLRAVSPEAVADGLGLSVRLRRVVQALYQTTSLDDDLLALETAVFALKDEITDLEAMRQDGKDRRVFKRRSVASCRYPDE